MSTDKQDASANQTEQDAKQAQYGWTLPTENGVDAKPKPKLIPTKDLDEMVAACMRDNNNEDNDDNEADEDIDELEKDKDLLSELQTITGEPSEVAAAETAGTVSTALPPLLLPTTTNDTVATLRQRLNMYLEAEAYAKESGEAARARRLERGIKTLQDLVNQALAGNEINLGNIPCEVSVKASTLGADEPQTPTTPTATAPPAEE